MARKHRATGKKPPGGARPGAGRPPGSDNALPLGAVRALKSLRHRVPEGAPEELADVAGDAFEVVVAVMRGEESDAAQAQARLKAAAMVREEVCGPLKQRVEHSFAEMTDEQLQAKYDKILADELAAQATVSATKPPEGGGS